MVSLFGLGHRGTATSADPVNGLDLGGRRILVALVSEAMHDVAEGEGAVGSPLGLLQGIRQQRHGQRLGAAWQGRAPVEQAD